MTFIWPPHRGQSIGSTSYTLRIISARPLQGMGRSSSSMIKKGEKDQIEGAEKAVKRQLGLTPGREDGNSVRTHRPSQSRLIMPEHWRFRGRSQRKL